MTKGLLARYFTGVAVKRLTAVEIDNSRSNQHEFNGITSLMGFMGTEDRKKIPTLFLWVGGENYTISENKYLSWYDARRQNPNRTEYRLYFPPTAVMDAASKNDAVFFAKRPDGTMMVIVTPAYSTMENQVTWFFDLVDNPGIKFETREISPDEKSGCDFAVRYILDELGFELEDPKTDYLDIMLDRFKGAFPSTRIFSCFARETLQDVNALDDADAALMAWVEQEEVLFRAFEKHILKERLIEGFSDIDGNVDTDGFIKFSLSVQNRRKSRAGLGLENHLEEIFRQKGTRYVRGAITENRAKPDFLFPGIEEYQDKSFPDSRLSMLGAKSTCKDRWRQILPEAKRIKNKHLFTLEPGISEHQTNEMFDMGVQLVLPQAIHNTYRPAQQNQVINLEDFIIFITTSS